MKEKIAVFHPMQQHSFRTAEALIENKVLTKYYTCIYYDESKFIYKILGKLLGANNIKRMKGRNNDKITPYVESQSMFIGLIFLLSLRLDKTNKINTFLQFYLSKKMGKKVAKRLIKADIDIVIGYDGWTYGLLKELKKQKSNIKVIVDFSSLYAEEIVSIINTDITLHPNIAKNYAYSAQLYAPSYIKYYNYEIHNADYFFSPSTVVDQSLTKHGVSEDKIYRCQYGANFKKNEFFAKNRDLITFIYIGRLTHAKGVHYLIEAFNKIKRDDYKLILIGEDIDNFSNVIENKNIEAIGLIQHDELHKYLEICDVAISASIYDGFSLALLESIAYNLPLICTSNMGISDIVENDKNGFVVNPFNSDELTNKINFFLDNKDAINRMGEESGKIIDIFTWEKYNAQVNGAIENILTKGGG